MKQVVDMISRVHSFYAAPGRFLLREQYKVPGLIVIVRGQVAILVKGEEVARRFAGEALGELSLLENHGNAIASASCLTISWGEFSTLSYQSFQELIAIHPDLLIAVQTYAKRKNSMTAELTMKARLDKLVHERKLWRRFSLTRSPSGKSKCPVEAPKGAQGLPASLCRQATVTGTKPRQPSNCIRFKDRNSVSREIADSLRRDNTRTSFNNSETDGSSFRPRRISSKRMLSFQMGGLASGVMRPSLAATSEGSDESGSGRASGRSPSCASLGVDTPSIREEGPEVEADASV